MAFVDPLAFQLFSLAFVAALLFYSGVTGYMNYRRFGPHRTFGHLQAQAVPPGAIGAAISSIGMWGELVWPLPGSYNILFFDLYLMIGLLLLIFAISVHKHFLTQYAGILAGIVGIMSIYYGITAYNPGLTKEPLIMLFLYLTLGGTALLTFPVTVFIDRVVVVPALTTSSKRLRGFCRFPCSGEWLSEAFCYSSYLRYCRPS